MKTLFLVFTLFYAINISAEQLNKIVFYSEQDGSIIDPEKDRKKFQAYFIQRFPLVPLDEFANGVYAITCKEPSSYIIDSDFKPNYPCGDW